MSATLGSLQQRTDELVEQFFDETSPYDWNPTRGEIGAFIAALFEALIDSPWQPGLLTKEQLKTARFLFWARTIARPYGRTPWAEELVAALNDAHSEYLARYVDEAMRWLRTKGLGMEVT